MDVLVGQSLEKWGFGNNVRVKNSNSIFPGSFEHAYIDNTQGLDVANTTIGGAPHGQGALSSFFARINYNYKEKYLFSAVMRADGSSNFAKGHRWGYFPSVSAGWVLSNEDFMASTKDWLSFLKIRGSWGQNGNCNIDAFQYVATIAFDAPYYFSDKSVSNTGAYPDIMPNENLKWETSEQLDFGVDARFFHSRLGVSFDWYNKMTRDWLVQAPTLLIYGSGAPYLNGGDIRNRGYEFLVSWNDNVGDFSYGVSATFSHNDNIVTRLANSEGIIHGGENVIAQNTAELYRVQVGYPIGYFWGYDVEGIIQNETDLQNYLKDHCKGDAANSLQKADIQPGDVKFVDTDGNGIINEEDKTMIGNPTPDYNVGLSINLAYKGFDFSVNGYGAFGQQIAKSYRHFSSKPDENYTTDVFTKYWTKEGSTDRYPRFTHGKHANMGEVSKIWIEDGDYFKISNITFGYDFKKLFKNMPLTRCRLYVSAQNMFTFTQYTGMDPEIGYGDGTEWMSGVDVGNYPTANAWIFGVNLTF
jgi:TonB-linked SusC/RagA family outer membrane protein